MRSEGYFPTILPTNGRQRKLTVTNVRSATREPFDLPLASTNEATGRVSLDVRVHRR
jgi:hypothetical protein